MLPESVLLMSDTPDDIAGNVTNISNSNHSSLFPRARIFATVATDFARTPAQDKIASGSQREPITSGENLWDFWQANGR
jgi:hypothetical protein